MPQVLGRRRSITPIRVQAPRPERPKTASRGYDHLWRKTSERHRRRHPFCVFCAQVGRQRLCDDVDHKIPIEDGGDRLKAENLQSLCRGCHNSIKGPLQAYARERGLTHLLPLWCNDPAARPTKFRCPLPHG